MFFGYPIEAIEENWLHDCLTQIIQKIHLNVASGNTSTDWLAVIAEPYKSRLQNILRVSTESNPRRLSLGDKLMNYQTKLAGLPTPEQNKLLQAFNNQNKIPQLLCSELTCDAINDFPESIQEAVKSVFEAAFRLLTNLEIRDKHYKTIYDECEYHTCPFCGCEYFDAPGAPREALDHYIPEHKYPFAAANLRNLVPMGNKCNSRYKLTEDVLRKADGNPRKSFDPYNHGMVSISLEKSQLFAGIKGDLGEPLPKWVIEFNLNTEEVDTWDEVFHIRERYGRDILNEGFKSYLREFSSYCKSWRFNPSSDTELIAAIDRYILFQDSNGFNDKAFIKAAVFRMFRLHCLNRDRRLITLLLENVNGVQLEA